MNTMTDTERKTKEVLISMLQENTGTHFLDSGGKSGRNWQRNGMLPSNVEFWDMSKDVSVDKYGLITKNVYQWLVNILDYDQKADEFFAEWANATEERRDASWPAVAEEFFEVHEDDGHGFTYGIYPGEGDEPISINTYNGECCLSQTLQFWYVHTGSHPPEGFQSNMTYVFLQIHGGADVRGGYTAIRIFTTKRYTEGIEIFDYGRVTASCECGHTNNAHAGWEDGWDGDGDIVWVEPDDDTDEDGYYMCKTCNQKPEII